MHNMCIKSEANMNYKQLYAQYFTQYKNISKYVKNLRSQLKFAAPDEEREVQRRVSILYSICLDLKHTSEYLKLCERRDVHE